MTALSSFPSEMLSKTCENPLLVKLDSEGRFLEVNDVYCHLFDRKAEELLGNWYMPLVHPDDRDYTEKMMQKLWRSPHRVDLENRAMTARGWGWLVWHVQAIVDSVGEIQGFHAVGRNVTNDRQHTSEGTMRDVMALAHCLEALRDSGAVQEEGQQKLAMGIALVAELRAHLENRESTEM